MAHGRDLADALAEAPARRRWFGVKKTATSTLFGDEVLAELAMIRRR